MMFAVYGGFAIAFILSSAVSVAFRDTARASGSPGWHDVDAADRPVPPARRNPGHHGDPVGAEGALGVPRLRAGRSPRRRERHPRRDAAAGRRADHGLRAAAGAGVLDAQRGALARSIRLRDGPFAGRNPDPRTGKLPFACTYLPGNSRIFTLWPIYLLAFFFYTVVFAAIDRALSSRPVKLAWFCVAATARRAGHRAGIASACSRALTALRFEEEDTQAIFQGFQLSEGLAAGPRTDQGLSASPGLRASPVP